MLDLVALLQPISDNEACGVDLEYDADFLALVEASRGRTERQVGESVIPAEPPDWRSIYSAAISLFERTKDLRIACILLRAATAQNGIQGLTAGLALIDGLCERYWPQVFPLLDADDNDDPTMRLNALAVLTEDTGLINDFGSVVLASARGMGSIKVREALVALSVGDAGASDQLFTSAQAEGLIQTAMAEGAEQVNFARQALDSAGSLQTRIRSLTNSYESVSLEPLLIRLEPLADLFDRVLATFAPVNDVEAGAGADGSGSGEAKAFSGEILSRDQALRALEKVCHYLEKAEPTNPAPLLIRRAQRLMTMSFLEIMRDMAPESVGPVQNIAGLKDQETEQN